MPDTQTQTERTRTRGQARQAADRIERSFPPEASAPLPFANSMQFSADAMKHWLATGQDMARFYNGRLAKDFCYMTELATCRTPGDIAALWWRAASDAAHDYADQLDRVVAINLDAGQEESQAAAE